MTVEVSVEGLSFTYPDGRSALNDVNLQIHRGERVALLGPNGAGKTTLALHLNGVLLPRSGRVVIGGSDVTKRNLREIRRRVGIVFQDPDDQLFMSTVRDDVAFGPANLGIAPPELHDRVDAALDVVGMRASAERPPHHLSFGQKRRVAIASVLAMSPEVLVLDEPTANLDPAGRRELSDVLEHLTLTVVLITHDLPYALQMCDRAILMDEGRIVAEGPTSQILADEALLSAHRLELPFGFDPLSATVSR